MARRWSYQHTPYLSALPGLAGPGMDVSNGDLPSKMYFVDTFDNVKAGGPAPEFGDNCFKGSLWWCWYQDQGADFSKFMWPLVGGYVFSGQALSSPDGRGNFDYVGHAAPGAGLFIQTAAMAVRGSNSRIWHTPSWVGDLPSKDGPEKFQATQRDALQGSSSTYDTSRIAHINCEGRWSMDETVQFWYATLGLSWLRGAIYEPLHIPPDFAMEEGSHHEPGVDHGYGHLLSGRADLALTMQSLYAHTTDRNPLVACANYSHINNLHYNHGRDYIGRGEGILIDDNGDYNEADERQMRANVVGNVTVRGPDQGDEELVLARVRNVTPGSSGYSALNSQYGWPKELSQSQEDFFKTPPADYFKPTPRRSAWPLGLGFDFNGVRRVAADPLNPTVQEGLEFVELMRETVGVMPSRRYLYKSGVDKMLDQIANAIRGVHQDPQFVNTVEEAGGWPELPTIPALDPTAPNAEWWHAPLPLGPDRDEIVTSGVLLDGSSAVGLSNIRKWIANQYIATLGR